MYFDTKKIIELCVKHGLTIEEVLIATLIYRDQFDEMFEYCDKIIPFSEEAFSRLEYKGFVHNLNIEGEYFPEKFVITDKFTDAVGIELDNLAELLWDSYPSWVSVGERTFKGRNISPETTEELLTAKMVRGRLQPNEFNRVITSLTTQKIRKTLGMGLRSWIESEQWKMDDEDIAEYGQDL